MSKNKKKTAREKRILVGAFLTAVVIAAGSTFAWFTSTDTVTNRLSANADYDVKIVESFAPPANWLPGEKVDKDVYAVNTGNIEAFAKATVSGVMSMTREVPVPITDVGGSPAHGDITASTTWYSMNEGDTDWTVFTGEPTYTGALSNVTIYKYNKTTYGEGEGNVVVTPPSDAAFYYVTGNGTKEQDGNPADPYIYTFYKRVDVQAANAADESWTGMTDAAYDCVELNSNEVYAIEAGAYLAYMPKEDKVNTVGNKAIAFKEPTGATATKYYKKTGDDANTGDPIWEEIPAEEFNTDANTSYSMVEGSNGNEDPTNYGKTDFTPHADGLYVFRRSIVVAPGDNKPGSSVAAGTETFEYEGYYFLGGKYYKIMNLVVNPDGQFDVAADGITTDGQLASASAYLVREEKVYDLKPDKFLYDAANNRIIASYNTNTENSLVGSKENLTELAAALDKAEHELNEAEVLLQRALEDSNIVNNSVKDKTSALDTAQANYNEALAAYEAAKAAFEEARDAYTVGKNALGTAKADALEGLKGLVGEGENSSVKGIPAADGAILAADPDSDEYDGTTLTNKLKNADGTEVGTLTIKPTADSVADKYGVALNNFKAWKAAHLITSGTGADTTEIDHHIYVYLQELAAANPNGATGTNGNYYELPSGWSQTAVPADVTHDDLVAELENAAKKLTYKYAAANLNWAETGDLHQYHQLLIALKIAEEDYNTALAEYNRTIGNLNEAIDNLGENGDDFKKIATGDTVNKALIEGKDAWKSQKADNVRTTYDALGGTAIAWDSATAEDTVLDYTVPSETEIQGWTQEQAEEKSVDGEAERNLWDAWQALQRAKKDLDAVRDQTFIDPATGLPYKGPNYEQESGSNKLDANGNPIIDESTIDNNKVAKNLEDAWTNYYNKRNAADEADRRLKAAQNSFDKDGNLNVYIYLKNVSLTGDTAKKWQLLPTTLADNKATFYYTSILAAGEVSEQLIDYVELDEATTKEMYKYFDFDLNVKLDSAQVGFDENGARNAAPANKAFDWTESDETTKHDITGMIQNPVTDPAAQGGNKTVVTWSESTTTGGNGEGGTGTGGSGAPDTPAPGGATYLPADDSFNGLPSGISGMYFNGSTVNLGILQAPMQIPIEGQPVVNYSFTKDGKTYYTSGAEGATVYEYTDSWSAVGTVSST